MQEADQHKPGNAYFLACLSKQWSDITFIPETPNPEAKACAEKGLAFAEKVSPPHPCMRLLAGKPRNKTPP